jgi:hypothetical protein
MRRTVLLMGLLLLNLIPARAGHTPPKVTLRIHVQTTGEGQSTLEVAHVRVPPDGEDILIRAIPELSESELVNVQQDTSGLHLLFNHTGTVDLNAATAQNQGRIMVVIIDGLVVYAPTIDTQITNGELDIPHPVPPAILQLLQQVAAKNVRDASKS